MNPLILFVNSSNNLSQESELMPILMTNLVIGLAIFGMLLFLSRFSSPNRKPQKTITKVKSSPVPEKKEEILSEALS